MAIIRTTNNETPSGGHPPSDGEPGKEKLTSTKSVVSQRKKTPAARSVTPRQQLPGVQAQTNTSRSFFADTMTELKRVVWPSREEVTSGSIVTILLLIFFGMYIGVLDIVAKGFFQMLGMYPNK